MKHVHHSASISGKEVTLLVCAGEIKYLGSLESAACFRAIKKNMRICHDDGQINEHPSKWKLPSQCQCRSLKLSWILIRSICEQRHKFSIFFTIISKIYIWKIKCWDFLQTPDFSNHPSIHPSSTAYPWSGRAGSSFSSGPHTSFSLTKSASSDQGIPRHSNASA